MAVLEVNKGEKWKQSGEMAFCEATPPDDRSRPLEWKRGFNRLQIPVASWSVKRQWIVHETSGAISAFQRTMQELYSEVTAAPSTRLSLELSVDEDAMRDSIYFFEESSEEKELFEIASAAGSMRVVIVEREVSGEGSGRLSKSIYGCVFRTNFEPGTDGVLFDLGIPKVQLEQLIERLSSTDTASLSLSVLLEAFTDEVDDALREHYHRRGFVIKGMSHAYLDSVDLSCEHCVFHKKTAVAEERPSDAPSAADRHSEMPGHVLRPGPPSVDTRPIALALERMTMAIWGAVVVAVLVAVFS
jgi:hypothetical protein